MSAGKFQTSVYVTDKGLVTTIRHQPETIQTWNPVATGTPVTGAPSAKVGSGRRTVGINARLARFKWSGNVPVGYDPGGVITLPIFTKAAFDAFIKTISYPYLGGGLEFTGDTPEKTR